MSVKVLIAGCLPKDKGQIESVVRNALGDRTESGPWNISLVKLGNSWSISLDGPDEQFRNLNLSAAEDGLHETITNALGSPAPSPSGNPAPTGNAVATADAVPAGNAVPMGNTPALAPMEFEEIPMPPKDSRDRYDCSECGQAFKVIYTPEPQDREAKAPVACPHCWHVNEVTVTESAAITEEYRAEAVAS